MTENTNLTQTIAPNLSEEQKDNSTPVQAVLVEDSVTHQAGEGITANRPSSLETPDIFDNSPQAVVKPQTADQELIDEVAVVVPDADTAANLEQLVEGSNDLAPVMQTLPDGSVDIVR